MKQFFLLPFLCCLICWQSVSAEQKFTSGYYKVNEYGQLVKANPPAINPGSLSNLSAHSEIITVGQRNAGASTILGGTVVPYREVTLTAQLPGRVQYIAGHEGDRFDGNALLLALSDDNLLAKREQAIANYNNSILAFRNSQMRYGREWWAPQSRDINRSPGFGLPSLFDQMFTRNIGSGMGYGNPWLERYSDLYSSGIHVAQAQGNQFGALAQIQEIESKLRDSATIAPFDGVIVQKMVEPGDTVQPGQPLLKFADLADLQLAVEVPSRLVEGLQVGMIAPAILDYNNQYIDARVARIYPMGNTSRHTITVKFDLPVGTTAWPGTYAEVMVPDINTPAETLIEIPKSAVVRHGSLPEVYVIKDNKPQLHLVRLGASYAEGRVTVLAGLNAGDRILVHPPNGNSSEWNKTPQGMNE